MILAPCPPVPRVESLRNTGRKRGISLLAWSLRLLLGVHELRQINLGLVRRWSALYMVNGTKVTAVCNALKLYDTQQTVLG